MTMNDKKTGWQTTRFLLTNVDPQFRRACKDAVEGIVKRETSTFVFCEWEDMMLIVRHLPDAKMEVVNALRAIAQLKIQDPPPPGRGRPKKHVPYSDAMKDAIRYANERYEGNE